MSLAIVIQGVPGQLALDGTDWDLLRIEGLSSPEITVYTEPRASGSGDVVTSERIDSRTIRIVCKSTSNLRNGELRHEALSFFRPSTVWAIHASRVGDGIPTAVQRSARNCSLERISIPEADGAGQIEMTLEFLCTDGYLESYEAKYGDVDPADWLAGYEIENDGDVIGYINATVVAGAGTVVRPFVELTYGGTTYKIQSNLTLAAGSQISFNGYNKTLQYYSGTGPVVYTPVYGLLLNDWRAVAAPLGASTLHVGAASNEANIASVTCSLMERFMGV